MNYKDIGFKYVHPDGIVNKLNEAIDFFKENTDEERFEYQIETISPASSGTYQVHEFNEQFETKFEDMIELNDYLMCGEHGDNEQLKGILEEIELIIKMEGFALHTYVFWDYNSDLGVNVAILEKNQEEG